MWFGGGGGGVDELVALSRSSGWLVVGFLGAWERIIYLDYLV